jgi:hypothetical protein
VFSAAELIEVLHARDRRRFPLHADRPFGGFPPTWRAWFLSISERGGAVTGAPVADYIAVFLARPLRAAPKASVALDRWRGFVRLGRQQWEPAPRDQRGLRRFAVVSTALLHVVLCLLLLWVGFVAIGDAPPEAQQAGESVQVEYIGVGTPTESGGAPAPGETDAPAAASAASGSPAQAAAATVPPQPASASAVPETSSDQPPQPAEASAAQPLAVTDTLRPDIDFTLPAPVPRDLTLPRLQVQTPEIASEIVSVEAFEPRAPVRVLERPPSPLPTPTVPTLRAQVAEVEALRQDVPVRELAQTTLRTPQLREPTLRATPSDIEARPRPAPATAAASASTASVPTPASPAAGTAPGSAASSGRASSASTAAAPGAATSGGRPQAQGTGQPTGLAPAGAGPAPSPRPGAAASARRADDWGDSTRNVPGNSTAGRSPGLFNSDGSVRLPGDGGRAGGGLPPGTITEDFEKIDRMGTWLKRPPLDYTPTRFDRFWIPNRSLLEEWVSRGIKKVAIPIPGTTKRIECTVSLLQAGGGCTIYDPNLQDQEAIARPPPDVPFKPELQEDKDSLKK